MLRHCMEMAYADWVCVWARDITKWVSWMWHYCIHCRLYCLFKWITKDCCGNTHEKQTEMESKNGVECVGFSTSVALCFRFLSFLFVCCSFSFSQSFIYSSRFVSFPRVFHPRSCHFHFDILFCWWHWCIHQCCIEPQIYTHTSV